MHGSFFEKLCYILHASITPLERLVCIEAKSRSFWSTFWQSLGIKKPLWGMTVRAYVHQLLQAPHLPPSRCAFLFQKPRVSCNYWEWRDCLRCSMSSTEKLEVPAARRRKRMSRYVVIIKVRGAFLIVANMQPATKFKAQTHYRCLHCIPRWMDEKCLHSSVWLACREHVILCDKTIPGNSLENIYWHNSVGNTFGACSSTSKPIRVTSRYIRGQG